MNHGLANDEINDALYTVIKHPLLENARALEKKLATRFGKRVFGRINQKASIEAASESDRGVTERLANAFDASLTAGRLAVGIEKSDRTLTPRNAAQRFFCLASEQCEWTPQDGRVQKIAKPAIEFWPEAPESKHRFRKHNPTDGLVSVLVRDFGTGLARAKMPDTILSLNTEAKLQEFEAIGQFGHGGSSALAFCESCLIVTQPRFDGAANEFYWTLIFPEREQAESKQDVIRKWFCDGDQLPLIGMVEDFPELSSAFPGTSIWHFGYNRGGWIKRIAGPEQSNPWGRLTRLFFSYPLPFEMRGVFARTDTETGRRTVKAAFYRIADQATDPKVVEYKSGEKQERLTVEGQNYGEFSVYVFVFKDSGALANYVDSRHPVILTLNGQNHGEMTRMCWKRAPERLAFAMIDPPTILEFVTNGPMLVAEGTRVLAKFKSDARPPKYSFHGDNPRIFARLECVGEFADRLAIAGRADINDRGYGSVTLENAERNEALIEDRASTGTLVVSLQSADGRILEASLDIGVRPKPEPRKKAVRQSVKTQIVFCAPENEDREALQELLAENRIEPFGAFLTKYGEALEVPADECTYWGEKSDTNGESLLTIEINAGNSQLKAVLKQCRTVDERIKTKERYVRDVVLDCYQYSFELQETPETVREAIGGDADERRRAADIHLNNDKALRIALDELNANRTR